MGRKRSDKSAGKYTHPAELVPSSIYSATQKLINIPPIIRTDNCSEAQKLILQQLDTYWWVNMHWFLAYRSGCISMGRKPLNEPLFRSSRVFGQFYSRKLDLYIGICEIKKLSDVPVRLWLAEMWEKKQLQYLRAIDNKPSSLNVRKKCQISEYKKDLSIFKKAFSTSTEDALELAKLYHPLERQLLTTTIKLATRQGEHSRKFRDLYWEPYLAAWEAKIDKMDSSSFQLAYIKQDQLYITAKRKPLKLK